MRNSRLTSFFSVLGGKEVKKPSGVLDPGIAHRQNGVEYKKTCRADRGKWLHGRWQPKLCIHGKRGERCKPCHGAAFCPHAKRRDQCSVCCPSGYCPHRKRVDKCVTCGGKSMCAHGIQRTNCRECQTTERKLGGGNWCVVCVDTRLSQRRQMLGVAVCAKCDPDVAPRVEEVALSLLAAAWVSATPASPMPPPSAADNQVVGRCGGAGGRRPDMCWVGADRIVHLEIDEHSHRGRAVSCELSKLDDTNFGVREDRHKPTLFVRFNPDCEDLAAGIAILHTALRRALTADVASLGLCPTRANVVYVAYGAGGQKHIDAAVEHPTTIKVVDIL